MSDRRITVASILAFSLLTIALIVYFLFFYNFGGSPNTIIDQTEETAPITKQNILTPESSTPITDSNDVRPPAATLEEKQVAGFKVVAENFVERFGTYSSQSGISGLDDLRFSVTDKMFTWLESQYQARAKADYKVYYGFTTRSISSSVLSSNEASGTATVLVEARRSEDKDGQVSVLDQSIKIDLIKVGKNWRVDGVYWQ